MEEKKENTNPQVESATKPSKKKVNVKLVIIAICLIVVIAIATAVVMLLSQYNNATKALESKKYSEAITAFEKINWYSDSKSKLNEAYLGHAKELMNADDCSTALQYFEKAGLDENNEDVKYCKLFVEYYDDFKLAEEYYTNGELAKAQEKFNKIDSTFKYKDVSVADRLATLKEYETFVKLTGTKSGKGKMEIRHIWKYDGSWDSWYADYTSYADVTAKIQEDGSVKISVEANFYSYSKWSSLSYGLGEKVYTSYHSVTVKKGGKIPSSFGKNPAVKAPSGTWGYGTLTYKNGVFKLSFLLDDKNYSTNFRNKYTSTITYNK